MWTIPLSKERTGRAPSYRHTLAANHPTYVRFSETFVVAGPFQRVGVVFEGSQGISDVHVDDVSVNFLGVPEVDDRYGALPLAIAVASLLLLADRKRQA